MNDEQNPKSESDEGKLPERTKIREAVLQFLYARDVRNDDRMEPEYFLKRLQLSPEQMEFGKELSGYAVEHMERIDRTIREHSENWELERMAVVDRNVLRLGVAEMLSPLDTPRTVVINECVELAKRLGSKESHRFVNALLDKVD